MNEPTPTAPDLVAWLPTGWNQHDERPKDVVGDLAARVAQIGGDAAGAEALRLAEHVWLSHLQDLAGLRHFLQALPAAAADAPAVGVALQRARWVLAMLEGTPAPAVDDLARWRGMQNLWSVWTQRGRAVDATAMLDTECARALAESDPAGCRALAASCNNLAAELRAGPRGQADRDALMLQAARASRRLWPIGGTWLHVERADYQLARCHAVLGQGDEALQHAQTCLAAIDAHAGDPAAGAMEYFYAHEALAHACRAAGDAQGAATQRQHMQSRLAAIDDADTQAWCARDLAAYDTAG